MAASNQTVNQIKVWIFPMLVSILGTIIWNDVKEIKTDVKSLMTQSNIDKTRIDNLEKQFDFFRHGAGSPVASSTLTMPVPLTPGPVPPKDSTANELYIDTRQKRLIANYGKPKEKPRT